MQEFPTQERQNGRLDIDDDVVGTVKRVAKEARQWTETQTNGGKRQ